MTNTAPQGDAQVLQELSSLMAKLCEVTTTLAQATIEKANLEAKINELTGYPVLPLGASGACAATRNPIEGYAGLKPVRRLTKGSNVALYVQILGEYGRPMHVTEITKAALERGLELDGRADKPPESKVRHSLSRSPRVTNLGDNIWWLAGEPVPA